MTIDRLQILVNRFARAAEDHGAAMESMKAEDSERLSRMITGLAKNICMENAGKDALLALTESSVPAVAGMAALHCIRFNPDRCTAVLRRLAAEQNLLGFRAAFALERWEAGEWELC